MRASPTTNHACLDRKDAITRAKEQSGAATLLDSDEEHLLDQQGAEVGRDDEKEKQRDDKF